MEPSDSYFIFVYGILRAGGSSPGALKRAKRIGEGRTVERFGLFIGGLPYAAKHPKVSRIVGEVYDIESSTLSLVDRIERHPTWYRREIVEVELTSGDRVQAWMYFNDHPEGELVLSGDYLNPDENLCLYFAYGSNMDTQQMGGRCPGAELIGTASLKNHAFFINRRGVATILPARDNGCEVWGVLWRLPKDHERALDKWEGVAAGVYTKENRQVELASGGSVDALVYVATNSDLGRPRADYLDQILEAARLHGFPGHYQANLRKWEADQ